MSRVVVTEDAVRQAGHALIRIVGGGPDDGRFRISRPEGWGAVNLGHNGWQASEETLQADQVSRDGPDLVLAVGPEIVNVLENSTYYLTLTGSQSALSMPWPDIEPLHSGASSYFPQPAPPQTPLKGEAPAAPEDDTVLRRPPEPPPRLEPTITPAKPSGPPPLPHPVPEPPPDPKPPLWPILVGILLLAIVAGGAYWYVFVRPKPAGEPTPPPREATVPPAIPDTDPNTLSVPDLVARNRPAEMVDQARRRLATRPGDAMLLLESAADDKRDGPAQAMLAALYDPNKPRQGGIPADPGQAAKYYQAAERSNERSGAADREALRRTLEQKRDAGDVNARLILGQYWP